MIGKRTPYSAAILILSLVLASFHGSPAHGQKKKADKPVVITPASPSYMVLKDVNIRALPKTSSKRVGRLRKGKMVQAKGRAKGTEWINVLVPGGNKTGFVYGTALAAVIDGGLKNVIKGNLSEDGFPSCNYQIFFEGKFKIKGENQRTADYRVPFQCDFKSKTIKFTATMFLTEFPYRDRRKEEYQINVDLTGLPLEEEDVLSVISLYHPRKRQVIFDSLNDKSMGSGTKISPRIAPDVPKALIGAVEIAYRVWGEKFWRAVAERK